MSASHSSKVMSQRVFNLLLYILCAAFVLIGMMAGMPQGLFFMILGPAIIYYWRISV